MSWWVGLEEFGTERILQVKSFEEGGTYCLGGSDLADLNVTYNYGGIYRRVIDEENGLWTLNGLSAQAALDLLEPAIVQLDNSSSIWDNDYWAATDGNAKRPLVMLAEWCRQAIETEKDYRVYVH